MRFSSALGAMVGVLLAAPLPAKGGWLEPPPRPHAIHILALPYLVCPRAHRLETITVSLSYWGWQSVRAFQPGPLVNGTPSTLSLWQRQGNASLWVRHGVPEACILTTPQ